MGYMRLSLDLIAVDRDSTEPMHRQIYGTLRRYILEGRIRAQTLLPSTRTLAKDLKVGRNTVIAAYDQLFAEGFLESRPGLGTWVAPVLERGPAFPVKTRCSSQRLSRRGRLMAGGPQLPHRTGLISLRPGEPESASFPFSTWSSLLTRNSRSRDENLLNYTSFGGHAGLRETIAGNVCLSRGITCAPEQVIVVTGAQAALDLVSRILLDEGDHAWLEEPGYQGATGALLAAGARLAPLKVSRQGWRLDDPDLPVPRLIYVTPSCQWPFGITMRIEERLRLLDIAERSDAWIVEDDYDGDYYFHGKPIPALRALDHADRVIYIGTFGKTLIPAVRIGYLVVPKELVDPFEQAVSISGQFAPLLLQATVNDFIKQGYFATHLRRMRRLYAGRQATFLQLCREHLGDWLSVAENDCGMQLLATFKQPFRDDEVVAAARKEGLDVHAVSTTYHLTEPEHGLMLGYAALDEHKARRAVAALHAAFKRLTQR
jgi:GntR family transcriptional regulator / MocR family aminotransferase